MKCSRSDSEQTSGTLEIFSRAIFLGTLCNFVKIVSLVIRGVPFDSWGVGFDPRVFFFQLGMDFLK